MGMEMRCSVESLRVITTGRSHSGCQVAAGMLLSPERIQFYRLARMIGTAPSVVQRGMFSVKGRKAEWVVFLNPYRTRGFLRF